jgi:hypothetical protein
VSDEIEVAAERTYTEDEVTALVERARVEATNLPAVPGPETAEGVEHVTLFDFLDRILDRIDLDSTAEKLKWKAMLGALREDVIDQHVVIIRDNTDGSFAAHRDTEPPPFPSGPRDPNATTYRERGEDA